MNEIGGPPAPNGVSPFERIRRTNASGAEYWPSREFAQVLAYTDYRNFEQVIKKAKTACFNSGQPSRIISLTSPKWSKDAGERQRAYGSGNGKAYQLKKADKQRLHHES